MDEKGNPVKEEGADDFKPNRMGFVSALTRTYAFITIRDTEESLLLQTNTDFITAVPDPSSKSRIEARFAEKGKTSSKPFCSETAESVRRLTYMERDSLNPPGLLCLWNGILPLDDEVPELRDHIRSIPFVTRLPVSFDSAARCPRFLAFLNRVLPGQLRGGS